MSDLMFVPGAHNLAPVIATDGPVKTWSFSSLTKYEQCPYSVYLGKVEGFREPAGPAADRGTQLHTMLEEYVQGNSDDLPDKMRKHDGMVRYVQRLRELYAEGIVTLEEEWTFDREWNVCEPKTPAVWAVFKCDIVVHESDTSILIIDWKSGRVFGNELKHGTQGMFYAIAALMRHPELEYVEAEFAYIDHGQVHTRSTMTRAELPHFLPRLTKRALAMTTAQHFPANPSTHNCRWCRMKDEVTREDGRPACEWGIVA